MMRLRKMTKKLLIVISLLLVFSMLTAFTSSPDMTHVFDRAELLSEEQIENLEEMCFQFEQNTKMHALILTGATSSGDVQAVADDFYDEIFPSSGEIHGICIYLDMGQRQMVISTSGNMQYYLSDDEINWILDNATPYAAEGAYSTFFESALNDTKWCVDQGISAKDYIVDENGNITRYRSITPIEAVIAAICGLLSGSGSFYGIKKGYQKKKAKDHIQYNALQHFTLQNKQDILINRTVTTRKIEKLNVSGGGSGTGHGSTVHHSSSGRTHGGGHKGF